MKLLEIVLEHFECFRDYAIFKGTDVAIHKRAQILVADIWCLFEGELFSKVIVLLLLSMTYSIKHSE